MQSNTIRITQTSYLKHTVSVKVSTNKIITAILVEVVFQGVLK
jgi:hypothetical protein